jgi:hypothetical protein
MEIWEKLSPVARYAVIGGIVVIVGLVVLKMTVLGPSADYAQTRGLTTP